MHSQHPSPSAGSSVEEQIATARRRLHAAIEVNCLHAQIGLHLQAIEAMAIILVRNEIKIMIDKYFGNPSRCRHA